ncbi:hypothetical protein TGVAND_202445 [Toxoplasma gondii VAND]|uniref:Uncharacterized protein n=1 Tax=Toxoplasma gondii VAND TaxID=933077 RepID=A0A086Q341_TOXGO|nr:hypothetical protein TGVAND_202445 [Toxoplasma gondii VAND]
MSRNWSHPFYVQGGHACKGKFSQAGFGCRLDYKLPKKTKVPERQAVKSGASFIGQEYVRELHMQTLTRTCLSFVSVVHGVPWSQFCELARQGRVYAQGMFHDVGVKTPGFPTLCGELKRRKRTLIGDCFFRDHRRTCCLMIWNQIIPSGFSCPALPLLYPCFFEMASNHHRLR